MKKIGITGGVGAGKSAVMAYLQEEYGAVIILADDVARRLTEPRGECFEAVCGLFGDSVLSPSGEPDRKKIAAAVFGDPELLRKLNDIVHPAVKRKIISLFAEEEARGTEWVFLEAALLIEEKYDEICDELWYVYADEEVRIARLSASRGYSKKKSRSIMKNQLSDEAFRTGCAFTIDNSGDFEETKLQIDARIRTLRGAFPAEEPACDCAE